MALKKGSLGKGLEAIFTENETEQSPKTKDAHLMNVSEIEPNRNQPRKNMDDEALSELSDSILRHGVLQPILVKPIPEGGYRIVAGERRYRAARMAGLREIPVVIKELSEQSASEVALIENLQRQDLTPIEEANGYKELMQEYDLTQEDIAKAVGKSRPAIANMLRLLNLPEEVIDMTDKGELSFGHARALLGLENEDDILRLAKYAIDKDISVRTLETLIRANTRKQAKKQNVSPERDKYFNEVELSLNEALGRKVTVKNKTQISGKLEIEFYSKDDLRDIANKLA